MGDKKKAEPQYQRKRSWLTRLVRWVNGTPEPAERYRLPGLVAYFWTGGAPQAHPVSNISTSGLYLLTKERWMSDTVLLMNLQSAGTEKGKSADSISVLSQVVRTGENGVGLKFVTPDSLDAHAGQLLPPIQTDKETLERFLKGFKRAEPVEVK